MKTTQELMTIREFIDNDKHLKVDSEYQRAAEWSLKQERLLIDSLMRGYPLPMFYLHKKVSKSSLATNTSFLSSMVNSAEMPFLDMQETNSRCLIPVRIKNRLGSVSIKRRDALGG